MSVHADLLAEIFGLTLSLEGDILTHTRLGFPRWRLGSGSLDPDTLSQTLGIRYVTLGYMDSQKVSGTLLVALDSSLGENGTRFDLDDAFKSMGGVDVTSKALNLPEAAIWKNHLDKFTKLADLLKEERDLILRDAPAATLSKGLLMTPGFDPTTPDIAITYTYTREKEDQAKLDSTVVAGTVVLEDKAKTLTLADFKSILRHESDHAKIGLARRALLGQLTTNPVEEPELNGFALLSRQIFEDIYDDVFPNPTPGARRRQATAAYAFLRALEEAFVYSRDLANAAAETSDMSFFRVRASMANFKNEYDTAVKALVTGKIEIRTVVGREDVAFALTGTTRDSLIEALQQMYNNIPDKWSMKSGTFKISEGFIRIPGLRVRAPGK